MRHPIESIYSLFSGGEGKRRVHTINIPVYEECITYPNTLRKELWHNMLIFDNIISVI
jgi:hypothetical protein